ncbi:MAG: hypothetical protein A2Y38_17415 [Spirochaetes bacterium GWB1_59_5]|nr:MAG: hypothetical protein A2Y38_17415 [Spirochaetes bacterium GWB1_59_5]
MSQRFTVLVDMDGMVVDFLAPMFVIHKDLTGDTITAADIVKVNLSEVPALAVSHAAMHNTMASRGFFRHLKPIPGALEAVQAMTEFAEVVLVTALPHSVQPAPSAAEDKLAWCDQHLSFIEHSHIVFASSKQKPRIKANLILDDHPNTLVNYAAAWPNALAVGISYPYNKHAEGERVVLFDGHADPAKAWREMTELVKFHSTYNNGGRR